jgi:4-hydroxybenzoate polyprenyltransferase
MALLPGGNVLALVGRAGRRLGDGLAHGVATGRLDIENNGQLCMTLFRSNRDAGLLPALFFAVAAIL